MYARSETRRIGLFAGILLLALAAGCGNKNTSPTPVLTTDTLSGTLAVLGASSQSFTVNYQLSYSDAAVKVTSLRTVANPTDVTKTIGVGFGSIAFDGSCARSTTYTATAANINQVLTASGIFTSGVYCVQIFDSGTLTEPVTYTMEVQHY
ncbi:MAG: hypothetical protein ABI634_09310 [Acidobacteriota bacterium]